MVIFRVLFDAALSGSQCEPDGNKQCAFDGNSAVFRAQCARNWNNAVLRPQCGRNGNKSLVSNMNLKEKIPSDLKNALREKKTVDLSVLRMLQSAIRNKEIEKKKRDGLTDEEIVEVISNEIKKRKEAVNEYIKAQRQDLADKERSEIEVLISYMPKQMGEMEIREEVKKAIKEAGAKAQGELGKVMKILMPRMKGKADGALVNKVVREELQKLEEL